MKKIAIILFLLSIFTAFASVGFAETYTHPTQNWSVWIPAGWQLETHPNDEIIATSPGGDFHLFSQVASNGSSIEGTIAAVLGESGMLSEFQLVKKEKIQFNGVPADISYGKAKFHGTDVNVTLGLLSPGNFNHILVLFGNPGAWSNYDGDISQILESINKI